jgi:hypothetical protein
MLGRPKRDISLIRQIKEWAHEALPISTEATVSVMELECREPGCPPLETVIVALDASSETRQWKIHKSMPEITRSDVIALASPKSSSIS